MKNFLANVTLHVLWADRPESREDCSNRIFSFMEKFKIYNKIPQKWRHSVELETISPAIVGHYIQQNFTDVKPKPIENLGWSGTFSMDLPEGFFFSRFSCGGWSTIKNSVIVRFPKSLHKRYDLFYETMRAAVESFDPDYGSVFTSAAADRTRSLSIQLQYIDWMIYVRNEQLASVDIPEIFCNKRLGPGSFIATKNSPVNLGEPEDLALIERIDPLIRQFVPEDIPKPPLGREIVQ